MSVDATKQRGAYFPTSWKKGYVTFSKKKLLTWVWPSDGGGVDGGGAGMVGSGWKGCLVNLD